MKSVRLLLVSLLAVWSLGATAAGEYWETPSSTGRQFTDNPPSHCLARTAEIGNIYPAETYWTNSPYPNSYKCTSFSYTTRYYYPRTCDPGMAWDSTQAMNPDYAAQCATACEFDPTITASSPACVPPQSCPAGQSWASPSNSCVPNAPEPEGGATDEVGVEVCRPPTDCSSPSNWDEWSYTTNKDGWIWKASDPHQCVQMGTGSVVCNTQIVYAAGGPATTSTVGSVPVASGTSYAPPVTVSCPTGYTLNSSGVCEQPPVAGTPTTDTTPGSTGSPGAVTCPVGYYADGSGGCKSSGTGAPNAYGCPEGYTKAADGSCQGAGGEIPGVFGPDATGANKVSSCGGPGQPACKVDTGTSLDVPVEEAIQGQTSGISAITPVVISAPAAQCPADVQLPHGITWSWATVCDFAAFLRPFVLALAWLAAGMFVLAGVL